MTETVCEGINVIKKTSSLACLFLALLPVGAAPQAKVWAADPAHQDPARRTYQVSMART